MTADQNQQKVEPPNGGAEEHLARHGKVSFMEIPAPDPRQSAAFYEKVFGWTTSSAPNHVSFDDTPGGLVGHFTPERKVVAEPGDLPYIYIKGLDSTLALVGENGSKKEREPYPEGGLWVATFRDPAGNLIGAWQAGGR